MAVEEGGARRSVVASTTAGRERSWRGRSRYVSRTNYERTAARSLRSCRHRRKPPDGRVPEMNSNTRLGMQDGIASTKIGRAHTGSLSLRNAPFAAAGEFYVTLQGALAAAAPVQMKSLCQKPRRIPAGAPTFHNLTTLATRFALDLRASGTASHPPSRRTPCTSHRDCERCRRDTHPAHARR